MSWITAPISGDIPAPRGWHSATAVSDERMVVFGGATSDDASGVYFDDTWLFDNSQTRWTKLTPTGDIPPKRAMHAAASCEPNKLIVFGGFNGKNYLNDAYLFDVTTSVWKKLNLVGEVPVPRGGHSLSVFTGSLGSSIVLFGGKNESGYLNDVFILDFKSNIWIKPKTSGEPASPRAFHSATILGKNLVIFGGEIWYKSFLSGDSFNDVAILNSMSMRWTKPTPLNPPAPRHGHTGSTFGDAILIFGGISHGTRSEDPKAGMVESTIPIFDAEEPANWTTTRLVSAISGGEPVSCHFHSSTLLHASKLFVFGGLRTEFLYTTKGIEIQRIPSNDLRIFYHLDRIINTESKEISPGSPKKTPRSGRMFRSPPLTPIFEKKQKRRSVFGLKPLKDKELLAIGTPYNLEHKAHVDFDMNWSSADVFLMESKLGEGAYGAVFKARHRDSQFVLAIKEIKLNKDSKISQDLLNEIEILKKCRHRNIVSYFGTCTLDKAYKFWILMDYCQLGSVRDLLEISNRTLSEAEIAYIVQQTLGGLLYLHNRKIIHRDVKCANILLTSEAEVKIADFGISDSIGKAQDSMGTPLWMAPEVINRAPYDNRCDIWSLGITIIEMADGFPPHFNIKLKRAMMMIPIKPPPTVAIPAKFTTEFNQFLAKCVVKEADKRDNAVNLMMHPFVQRAMGPEVLQQRIKEVLMLKQTVGDRGISDSDESDFSENSPGNSAGINSGGNPQSVPMGTFVEHEDEDDENSSTFRKYDMTSVDSSIYETASMGTMKIRTNATSNMGTMKTMDTIKTNDSRGTMRIRSNSIQSDGTRMRAKSISVKPVQVENGFQVEFQAALEENNRKIEEMLTRFKSDILESLTNVQVEVQVEKSDEEMRKEIADRLGNLDSQTLKRIFKILPK